MAERTGVQLRFIEPGMPVQNAFIESFNAGGPEAVGRLGVGGSFADIDQDTLPTHLLVSDYTKWLG